MRPAVAAMLLLGALVAPASAQAVGRITVEAGAIEGPGWSARGLTATLDLGRDGPGLGIRAASLRLPDPVGSVADAGLRCPRLELAGGAACPGATLRFPHPLLDAPETPAALAWRNGRLEATLGRLRLAGGTARVEGRMAADGAWRGEAELSAIDLAAARADLAVLGLDPGLELSGRLSGRVSGSGNPEPTGLELEARAMGLAFSAARGARAGEGLAAELEAQVQRTGRAWRGTARLGADAGQSYLQPWFLDLGRTPLHVRSQLVWDPPAGRLRLADTRFDQEGVTRGNLSATLATGPGLRARSLSLVIDEARLPEAYATWLQPLLLGTPAGDLDTGGMLSGRIVLDAEGFGLDLLLDDLLVEDRAGRFGIQGARGPVRWHSARLAGATRLGWEGGHLWALPIGPARLEARAGGGRLQLASDLRLPLLDGTLELGHLDIQGLQGDARPAGSLEAILTPVSMERLTQALGWPAMGGQVSGIIPRVRLAGGRLAIEGALLVRAFDGSVVVRDLVLEEPFGVVPRLTANVDVQGLALEPLTRAFDFGRITGRIAGRVESLVLENWQPVAFDARLETPPDDDMPHRISQRAVDALATLGGAGGALSRTFLSMFEEFGYRRLGLGCTLRDGVCRMAGVAPADGGYFIVQGGGLPRIDVIGYNREVDWDVLVERLRLATEAGAPVVQ